VPSGGKRPVSLALRADRLYVSNQGNPPSPDPATWQDASYTGFAVAADGGLTPIPGATVPATKGHSPTDILLNPDGRLVIAARPIGSLIDTLSVAADGSLTQADQLASPSAFAMVLSPTAPDQLFVALVSNMAPPPAPGVAAYKVAPDGKLTF